MNNIFGFFKSSNNTQSGSGGKQNHESIKSTNPLKISQNWYEERSDKLIVQRNLLIILIILLTIFMVISTLVIAFVVKSKQFDPFVIQLNSNTGRAAVVEPISSSTLTVDESLTRYFIKKYITARETYNPVDFATIARTTVRLFSTSAVYYNYLGYIRNKDFDPTLKYKADNTTFLVIKSWSKIAEDKYIVRFSVNETSGSQLVYNKIAVVSYDYVPMQLTDSELDINPVGFQVNGYRVDDDNS
ncbi:VirB8 family type IV secretion system protein [Rickettsia typhi]|uniref:VirB8-like protein of the Type IV secretion system n=2 Tax=Rickettsia typhi TaxID=785 RepID=Q68X82_RICTY|nr:virB8 family protein [Rickettsia typhi]AAU03760.1 VirB8-like protein of the Type IV secretion system [Rickettsia typhi str. Wilmington]AFE54137.1 VirB8-like protein of the Type IV secretion system [Rickettsia typhi str. TH1527]AFE54976.1 VirB8-like protein of the Type IV secretion system [Rickettsia typhi str. B9991CWPP]